MFTRHTLLTLGLFGALLAAAPAPGEDYAIDWYTVDGGGEMGCTGSDYELSGTIGQPDANPMALTGGTFELLGGFWPAAAPPPCRGDCNCDGAVNFRDINPFVGVLGGAPPCNFDNCDINGDGAINFADINPFVALLSTGGGPCP